MMLLPPRSTLFPYTTLFRSIVQLIGELQGAPRRLVREALQRQGSEEDGLAGMVDRLIKYQLSGIFRSQNRDLLLENGLGVRAGGDELQPRSRARRQGQRARQGHNQL